MFWSTRWENIKEKIQMLKKDNMLEKDKTGQLADDGTLKVLS